MDFFIIYLFIVSYIDPCTLNQCINGGTCARSSATVSYCICPDNFMGDYCEQFVPLSKYCDPCIALQNEFK